MSLPPALRPAVEAALGPLRGAAPVGGGCISEARRLELESGSAFLKYHPGAAPGFFAAEAAALELLGAAGSGLRVPRVLAHGEAADGAGGRYGWIALEWLEPARRAPGFGERMGRGLARLHRAGGGAWGAAADGFIGALPQRNAPLAGWAEFWRERRLRPQLELARRAGRLPGREAEWEALFDRLPAWLEAGQAEGPSLLHGDLWGGNVLAVEAGEPALIDPSAYSGHREVDLAMSELFGGFGADFHAAYEAEWPLLPGYAERRRPLYQLYYLLVHVNLFGGAYGAQTAALLRRALAAG